MATPVALTGFWSSQSQNNAFQGRLLAGSFLPQANGIPESTTPLTKWRSGVLCTSSAAANGIIYDGYVAQNSGMSVFVYPCTFVVNRAGQGVYIGWAVGVKTLTLDASNSVNPRIDIVVARTYDPALGDTPPAQGRTTYEVITGTAAASPSPQPVPAGAVKLAEIAVAANASSITQANITDKRNGLAPGTGPRPLLGGDSLSDPGFVQGELRYRKASGGLPEMIDMWDSTGIWRGLRGWSGTLPITSSSVSTTTTATLASVAIPDPGFPYRVKVSGQMNWSKGINTIYYLQVRSGSPTGTLIGSGDGYVNSGTYTSVLTPSVSGVMTGATTLYYVLYRDPGSSDPASGVGWSANVPYNKFTYEIEPV